MMQQGLGALVPQQPAGQAPENPVRMAAAMDVVTSDAEENILDPRTLALIKYKDAVAAMQAADQLMAASQPTPTPPTVAERTKLAAQQGIMGLASRLAPGLQQQGSRMAAAQAQQAMGGGLPQLSAPNMAGMASGGIVGYAEGGDVQGFAEGGGPNLFPSPADTVRAVGALPNIFPSPADTARAVAFLAEKGIDATKFTAEQIAEAIQNIDTFPGKEGMSAYGTVERPSVGELVKRGLGSMSDEEIAAETAVTRSAAPRETREEGPAVRTTGALDSAYLSGLGGSGSTSPRNMGVAIASALDRFKNAMGYTDPRAAERTEKEAKILAQYADVERAQQARVAARQARRREDQGTGLDARYAMGLGGSSEADTRAAPALASTTPAVSATPAAAPVPAAATRDAVEIMLDQPRPDEMGPNATPAEYFRNQFRPAKAAAGADATTAAPQSRDDRMRRIIAGLRGLGAQGIGGFAAGTAEEAALMEQELIAEQERQRKAAAEDRDFGLREQELTLTDALRRADAEDRRFNQVMNLVQGFSQLEDNEKYRVGTAITDATKGISDQLAMINTALSTDLSRSDREEYEATKAALEAQLGDRVEEVTAVFGQGLDYRPIVETLLRSAMQGVGSGAGSFNANDFTVRTVTP